jgi:hypothetical protein
MFAERHLNDFAKFRKVKELAFHAPGVAFAASKVMLPVLMGRIMQRHQCRWRGSCDD